MHLSFFDSLAQVERLLTDAQRTKVPVVTMAALNDTAFDGRTHLQREIDRVFKAPRPFTIRSVLVKKARKSDLTADVYLSDRSRGTLADKYLQTQVFGGKRAHKRFEVALIARGVMPRDLFAVPAPGYPLGRDGMITGGRLMAMLSQLGAQVEVGFQQNVTTRSAARARGRAVYFANERGVFERRGKTVWPMLVFVRAPSYRPRLDMEGVLQRAADKQFPAAFEKAFPTRFVGAGR